jgi:formyl-CoA transferase
VFGRLCEAMGRPELATDPRYADHEARGGRQAELDDLIGAWTRTLTIAELEDLMAGHGVPAGRIYRAPDMLADPHFAAREAIIAVDHPRWPGLMMQNVFPKLSATPGRVRSIAPQSVGQDNAEVLGRLLGYDAAKVAALKARGVL